MHKLCGDWTWDAYSIEDRQYFEREEDGTLYFEITTTWFVAATNPYGRRLVSCEECGIDDQGQEAAEARAAWLNYVGAEPGAFESEGDPVYGSQAYADWWWNPARRRVS